MFNLSKRLNRNKYFG